MAFSEPYDDCGHHGGVVRHHRGQRAAEDRERAREHEARRLVEAAARVEQCARRVDVDPHAEVELRLRLTAHDRREVVDDVDVVLDHRAA